MSLALVLNTLAGLNIDACVMYLSSMGINVPLGLGLFVPIVSTHYLVTNTLINLHSQIIYIEIKCTIFSPSAVLPSTYTIGTATRSTYTPRKTYLDNLPLSKQAHLDAIKRHYRI